MNWKREATERLGQLEAMRRAAANLPLQIRQLQLQLRKVRTQDANATPTRGGGNHYEDRLINNIALRQELRHNLENARRWLSVTEHALALLDKEQQLILHRMYICQEQGAVDRLCQELGLEKSALYRRRDQALYLFTLALYGVPECCA